MRILVDADACPVKDIIIKIAKNNNIRTIFYFDNSHQYENDYAKVIIVDKGFDSVDFYILNEIKDGDLLVTQDFGLASLALNKNILCLNNHGLIINNNNIDTLLSQRYVAQKARKEKVRMKGPKKRTINDDEKFTKSLTILIKNNSI